MVQALHRKMNVRTLPVLKAFASTEVCALLYTTGPSASALLVLLEQGVRSMLTNALQLLATMAELASICHKATDATAPKDTMDFNAKRKHRIAMTILVPTEPCAETNLESETTLAFANPATQVKAAMSVSTLVNRILASMELFAKANNRVDSAVFVLKVGKVLFVTRMLMTVPNSLVYWAPTALTWSMTLPANVPMALEERGARPR